MNQASYIAGAAQVFTILFVLLGPEKLLEPFIDATRSLDKKQIRHLAWKSAVIASISIIAGGFLGRALSEEWKIETPVLLLAGGLVFLLVALRGVMKQYECESANEAAFSAKPPRALQIAFPMIVTPYGMAAVIVFLTTSKDIQRTLEVIGVSLAVMALNVLLMIYARSIVRFLGPAILRAFFSVLGMMVVALAIEMIVTALRMMGFLPD